MSGQPASEKDPIAPLQESYLQALKTGNVEQLVSLCCEDVVFMPPNETSLYGKAEVKDWYEEYFEHFQIASLSMTERDLLVLDGWAIERRSHMIAIVPLKGGERIRDDGRALFVWKRETGGAWKIAQFIVNSTRPIGSGTSRFLVRMKEREDAE